MNSSGNRLRRSALLVALGAVAGGAVAGGVSGWFAAELARNPADSATVQQLTERLTLIERRVPLDRPRPVRQRDRVETDAARAGADGGGASDVDEQRPIVSRALGGLGGGTGGADSESASAADPPDGDSGDNGDGAIPHAPPPEFVDLVRSAIDEIRRQDREGGAEQRVADERSKYMREVDKRLVNYREKLALTDEQVAAFRKVAQAGVDVRLAAQLEGAPRPELEALDRARQREFRDLLGGDGYREFRKLELDAAARPTIVSISGQAGVDREQRDRIERLLDEHIEGLVDLDVRIRTEELGAEESAAIRERMQAANRAAWDRLRESILDAKQRERVPPRLR